MDTDEPTATDLDAPAPEAPVVDRWPRRTAIASLVGLVAVVVALVVGILTQVSITDANSSLSATSAAVQKADHRLRSTRIDLTNATTQSNEAALVLAGDSAKLAAVQAQLAKAQANIFAKGVNISALDTCLSGVEQTLNQIAVGDVSGAGTTLTGVSATCKAALPAGS